MAADGDGAAPKGGRKLGLGILSAAAIARKNVRGISKNTKGVGAWLITLLCTAVLKADSAVQPCWLPEEAAH